jgi:hypothetical protein
MTMPVKAVVKPLQERFEEFKKEVHRRFFFGLSGPGLFFRPPMLSQNHRGAERKVVALESEKTMGRSAGYNN